MYPAPPAESKRGQQACTDDADASAVRVRRNTAITAASPASVTTVKIARPQPSSLRQPRWSTSGGKEDPSTKANATAAPTAGGASSKSPPEVIVPPRTSVLDAVSLLNQKWATSQAEESASFRSASSTRRDRKSGEDGATPSSSNRSPLTTSAVSSRSAPVGASQTAQAKADAAADTARRHSYSASLRDGGAEGGAAHRCVTLPSILGSTKAPAGEEPAVQRRRVNILCSPVSATVANSSSETGGDVRRESHSAGRPPLPRGERDGLASPSLSASSTESRSPALRSRAVLPPLSPHIPLADSPQPPLNASQAMLPKALRTRRETGQSPDNAMDVMGTTRSTATPPLPLRTNAATSEHGVCATTESPRHPPAAAPPSPPQRAKEGADKIIVPALASMPISPLDLPALADANQASQQTNPAGAEEDAGAAARPTPIASVELPPSSSSTPSTAATAFAVAPNTNIPLSCSPRNPFLGPPPAPKPGHSPGITDSTIDFYMGTETSAEALTSAVKAASQTALLTPRHPSIPAEVAVASSGHQRSTGASLSGLPPTAGVRSSIDEAAVTSFSCFTSLDKPSLRHRRGRVRSATISKPVAAAAALATSAPRASATQRPSTAISSSRDTALSVSGSHSTKPLEPSFSFFATPSTTSAGSPARSASTPPLSSVMTTRHPALPSAGGGVTERTRLAPRARAGKDISTSEFDLDLRLAGRSRAPTAAKRDDGEGQSSHPGLHDRRCSMSGEGVGADVFDKILFADWLGMSSEDTARAATTAAASMEGRRVVQPKENDDSVKADTSGDDDDAGSSRISAADSSTAMLKDAVSESGTSAVELTSIMAASSNLSLDAEEKQEAAGTARTSGKETTAARKTVVTSPSSDAAGTLEAGRERKDSLLLTNVSHSEDFLHGLRLNGADLVTPSPLPSTNLSSRRETRLLIARDSAKKKEAVNSIAAAAPRGVMGKKSQSSVTSNSVSISRLDGTATTAPTSHPRTPTMAGAQAPLRDRSNNSDTSSISINSSNSSVSFGGSSFALSFLAESLDEDRRSADASAAAEDNDDDGDDDAPLSSSFSIGSDFADEERSMMDRYTHSSMWDNSDDSDLDDEDGEEEEEKAPDAVLNAAEEEGNYGGGSGAGWDSDDQRPRRLLPVCAFRDYYVPEGFISEGRISATFKVRERRTRRHFAATFVFHDPGYHGGEAAIHATPAGTDAAKHLLSPDLQRVCALSMALQHPNLLRTFDVFYRLPEDAVSVQSLVQACTGASGDATQRCTPEIIQAETRVRSKRKVSLRLPNASTTSDPALAQAPQQLTTAAVASDKPGVSFSSGTVHQKPSLRGQECEASRRRGKGQRRPKGGGNGATLRGNSASSQEAATNHGSSGQLMRKFFSSLFNGNSTSDADGSGGSGSAPTSTTSSASPRTIGAASAATGAPQKDATANSTTRRADAPAATNVCEGNTTASTTASGSSGGLTSAAESGADNLRQPSERAVGVESGTVPGFLWPAEAAAELSSRERRVAEVRAQCVDYDGGRAAERRARIQSLSALLLGGRVVTVLVSELARDDTLSAETSLWAEARLCGGLPSTQLMAVTRGVASALHYLHTFRSPCMGLVHRAVGPHNVVLGANGVVKLANYDEMSWWLTPNPPPAPQEDAVDDGAGGHLQLLQSWPPSSQPPSSPSADMYGLGCTLLTLASGVPLDHALLLYHSHGFPAGDAMLLSLLRGLLDERPAARMTAEAVLQHPYACVLPLDTPAWETAPIV